MMELKDTIEMMTSEDYKERFKAEYHQLKIRCDKLEHFLDQIHLSVANNGLYMPKHDCPQEMLENQLKVMKEYKKILDYRGLIEGINLKG